MVHGEWNETEVKVTKTYIWKADLPNICMEKDFDAFIAIFDDSLPS